MTNIGMSELDASPVALGGNVFGWTADRETSLAILDAYAAGGGNFLDTSDSYTASAPGNLGGESETIIGEWFKSRGAREETILATKVSQHPDFPGLAANNIRAAAEASLGRLRTDCIDLYYAHAEDPTTPLEETAAAFDQLVRSGKTRYIGLSNFSVESIDRYLAIADANGYARPIVLQPHYNLVHRNHVEDHLVPLALREALGIVPYFALASGFLTGKYRQKNAPAVSPRSSTASKYVSTQGLAILDALEDIGQRYSVSAATVALAWLVAKPAVVAPIASASRVEQVSDLIAAGATILHPDEVARLDAVSAWTPPPGS